MKRLKIIGLIVAGLVAIAVIVAVVWPNDEPSWQGKKLTQWLEEQRGSSAFDYKRFFTEPRRAIEAIGTNGLPTLLKLLSATDSTVKKFALRAVNGQRLVRVHARTADEKHMAALAGYGCLGKAALPALPQIIKLTRHPDSNVCVYATWCCGAIEAGDYREALLTYKGFINSNDRELQRCTGMYLARHWPKEAEWYGVYETFPDLSPTLLVPKRTNGLAPANGPK